MKDEIQMKRIRTLAFCVVLLFTWCVPAAAAGAANYNEQIDDAVAASFTVGGYQYSLPGVFKSTTDTFLTNHPITDLSQADAIVAAVHSAQSEIQRAVGSGASPNLLLLPANVKTKIYLLMNGVPRTGLHFSRVGDSVCVTGATGTMNFPIPTLDRTAVSSGTGGSGGSGSSGTPSVPTVPAQPTQVVTANGVTQINIGGTPDSAPAVSGNKASLSMTVSADTVAAAVSATAQAPAAVNIGMPSDTIISQLNNPAVQSVDVSLNVPTSIAYGTAANTSVAMTLDPGILNTAAAAHKSVTVSVTDSLTERVAYSWTFNGADAAGVSATAPINLALSVQTTALNPTVSAAVPSANKGVLLTFGNNGALPVPATVRVYVGDQGYLPGQTAYLYYYNAVTNQIESLENAVSVVDADGYATFSFAHSSQYVVLPQKVAAVPHLTIDTGKYLSVKAGHSYQFKITGASKPTFQCGSANVFQVIFAGSNGNSYFYKVIAVGKPGQAAGFYVNGQKSPCTVGTIKE